MIYPKIGEWLLMPETGEEITAVPVPLDMYKLGNVNCVFMGTENCTKGCGCINPSSLYLTRQQWAIVRLTR